MPGSKHSELLKPVSGWSREHARHLIWRAGFGGSSSDLDVLEAHGLDQAVRGLVDGIPQSEEFESTQQLLKQAAFDGSSIENLRAWWLYRMLHGNNPLHERMTLLWHNHFATSYAKVLSVPAMSAQNDLFRREATGSFRTLLHDICSDVAMLVWLDGNANRKRQPNENFARELMELFSLDVGNYTEKDIQEAARAFTGWHVRKDSFWFNEGQHDPAEKTVFGESGPFNGEQIVELCLKQPACPIFIARKLLREFVCSEPEKPELEAVAGLIREHNFELNPVLQTLLKSQLFFDAGHRGRLIKSPIDLVVGTFRLLEHSPNLDSAGQMAADLGQDLFQPPTVKGWDGHRVWLTSATMLMRSSFASAVVRSDRFRKLEANSDAAKRLKTQSGQQAFLSDACCVPPTGLEQVSGNGRKSDDRREFVQMILASPEYQLK